MTHVTLEIAGFSYTSCSPFPCDATRTCGLTGCHPTGQLVKAFGSLKTLIAEEYGPQVDLTLTLLDEGVPEHIRAIIEAEHPPIPLILVNGRLTRIGRIAYDRIKKEIDAALEIKGADQGTRMREPSPPRS
ncbi:MAG TPA: hypothetical protein VLY83_06670 [Methanoregula sp.]|nr:hypothetical protein [Methanoregula sp.]